MPRDSDSWIGDLVGALSDPVILYPSPWMADLPNWVKQQITLERLIMNLKVAKEGGVPVGGTEVMAYIFPRTMESPMTEQWVRIYTHCFNEAMAFKNVEVPADLKAQELSSNDQYELDGLKRCIYESRVKHRKGIEREERRQSKEQSQQLATQPAAVAFF